MNELPNLELLNYIFGERLLEHVNVNVTFIPDVDVFVFPQVWPNTGGGLARPGYAYGCAMTKQYTTVITNRNHDFGMVAFGNKPAYFVTHLGKKFMDDIKSHSMASAERCKVYDERSEDTV